jgi:hypothetical protein
MKKDKLIPTVIISENKEYGYKLVVSWSSNVIKIDRPVTYGICHSDKNLLLRYKKAIEDRKMQINPTLTIDINNNFYVETSDFQIAKYLNNELLKIGY